MAIPDWLSPSISGGAAIISIYFAMQTRKSVRRQYRLQAFSLRRQFDADLRAWADKSVEALSEALTLIFRPPQVSESFIDQRERILCKLSAAADVGRWFYPNEDASGYGEWKSGAYRGFRHEALDALIDAFRDLKGCTPNEDNGKCQKAMVEHRKKFVSIVQERLDPRVREKELAELMA